MGSITKFNLQQIIDLGISHYVETGLGTGSCLSYALKYSFEEYHTCELSEELLNIAKEELLENHSIHYYLGYSHKQMNNILGVIPEDKKCLFWLDAHFPFVEHQKTTGQYLGDSTPENIPLESELRIIADRRNGEDVIICDDLRIYEDNNYENGTWSQCVPYEPRPGKSIDFVFELFGKTHSIHRDLSDEGYLILVPKTKE